MGSRRSGVAHIVRRAFLTGCLFLLLTAGLFGVLSYTVGQGQFAVWIPRDGFGEPADTIPHTMFSIKGRKGHIVLERLGFKNVIFVSSGGPISEIDKSLFGSFHYRVTDCYDFRSVELSCRSWIAMAVFGFPVILGTIPRWRLAHRRRRGLCISCGYNLTGNTSGRCPECGDRLESTAARHTAAK